MNDTIKYFTKKAIALLAAIAFICIVLIPLYRSDYEVTARLVMLWLSLLYLTEKAEWLIQKCEENDTEREQ